MDRKLLTALGLSVGIIWFWTKFVMIPPPDKPAIVTPSDEKPAEPKADAKSDPKPDAKPGEAKADAKPGDASLVRQPETFTSLEIGGRTRATLSSWGAALHDLVLLDPAYKEHVGGTDIPIDLVPSKNVPLPYSVTFPDSGFELPADADFTLAPGGDANERRYTWDSGTTHVEKHWRLTNATYEAQLEITVENRSDKAMPASLRMQLAGLQDPEVSPSMFKPSVVQTEGLCSTGKVKREPLASLLKEAIDVTGPVRVIAIDRKYFVLAAAIAPVEGSRCRVEATKSGRITVTLTLPPVSIAPAGKKSWTFTTFSGPKIVTELDAAKVVDGNAQVNAHLSDVVSYALAGLTEVFARLMLWVLKAAHGIIGNWGIAIVVLTLLLKLVTWWPTAQSLKSAAAMAKLKPEMDKLKEKFGDDKARMNTETMALYQKNKINPLGGCLPALIQMPIYIAFYSMLSNSVELYRANFGLWIHDLTAPDPFFVLPLLTGAVMFLQQKLSPAAVDPSQKTMMTMMPLMFTGMSIFLPAGLTLYILTNTAFSMAQQRFVMNSAKTPDAAPAAPTKKKAER